MASRQNHIIQQLTMEVEIAQSQYERASFPALTERLSLLAREEVPKLVDRVLSELAPGNAYYRFDKLVLDLEIENLDQLETVIRQQLRRQLKEVFTEEEGLSKSMEKRQAVSPSQPTTVLGPQAWIVHFLRWGSLPWAAPQNLSPEALAYECTELLANDQAFVRRLRQVLLTEATALKRMLLHFGPKMMARLVQGISGSSWPDEPVKETFANQLKSDGINDQTLTYWQEQLRRDRPQGKVANSRQGKTAESEALSAPTGKNTDRQASSLRPSDAVDGEQWYVQQAGLVLLHPFLGRLLQSQGLAVENKLTEPDRAASLVWSLATGRAPAAEWELVLPKVILGIPIAEVLTLPEISAAELDAGEEMIAAAIGHWSALGKTSVAGFRQSFLQRDGRLRRQADQWYLQVERAPYDLLLDRLPWNIGMIHLPWMEGMLHVEWN